MDAPEGELLGVVLGTTVGVGLVASLLAYLGQGLLAAYTGIPAAGARPTVGRAVAP